MRIVIIVIAVALLLGCSESDHNSSLGVDNVTVACDNEFLSEFNNCLLVVSAFRSGYPVEMIDRFRAIECLEAITGISSEIVKHSDSPYLYYQSYDADSEFIIYSKEFSSWINWVNGGSCSFNLHKAEEVIKYHGEKIGNPLTWPSRLCDPIQ